MPDAIVDTTVLIAFARTNLLHVLPQLYDRVLAPVAVYDEALRDPERVDYSQILEAFRAGQVRLSDEMPGAIAELAGMGAGEHAAVVLARDMDAIVVLDDERARRMARRLGLSVTGTVGLLIEGRRRGLIGSVVAVLDELVGSGFRIGEREWEAARRADEG